MPIVEVHLIEGYAPEEKTRLGAALTGAVQTVIPASPDAITVLMHEVAPSAYMRGGTHRSPAPALPDPAGVVRDFLDAMERRDLSAASGFLGEGFVMTFPGDARMTSLEEMAARAGTRYGFVTKTYERFDTAGTLDGPVVYCFGTLAGEWLDGTPFSGIRFIDRFEVRGGKLVRQDVWNDLAEVKSRG